MFIFAIVAFIVITTMSVSANEQQESVQERVQNRVSDTVNQQKEAAKAKRAEIQAQAEAKLKEAQEKRQLKSTELRQKACEAKKSALSNKINATSAAAKRHIDTIDKFNDKLNTFVEKYNLVVPGFEDLNAKVMSAKEEADKAVATLGEYGDLTIDCKDIDGATANAISYQTALKSARESILAYRMATKDLLVAIKTTAEKTEATDSGETTNPESSQDTTQENSN
jgi:hypothetical protein